MVDENALSRLVVRKKKVMPSYTTFIEDFRSILVFAPPIIRAFVRILRSVNLLARGGEGPLPHRLSLKESLQ